jgi:hypothetical protein
MSEPVSRNITGLRDVGAALFARVVPRQVVEQAPREAEDQHRRQGLEDQPELAVVAVFLDAQRSHVDSGTMNMTAYESRRPTMSVVTWWLTERDNQGLGKCGKRFGLGTTLYQPPQREES